MDTRDLPPPPPFKKLIGPSFIILGLGLGSGEIILWPYLTSNFGLGLVWAIVIGITMQFFPNLWREHLRRLRPLVTSLTFLVHSLHFFRLRLARHRPGRSHSFRPRRLCPVRQTHQCGSLSGHRSHSLPGPPIVHHGGNSAKILNSSGYAAYFPPHSLPFSRCRLGRFRRRSPRPRPWFFSPSVSNLHLHLSGSSGFLRRRRQP